MGCCSGSVFRAALPAALAMSASFGCAADNDMGAIDANMRVPPVKEDGLAWHSPKNPPFRVSGFAWFEKEKTYRRLPAKPAAALPSNVDYLANCTAGGKISFRSDTTRLAVKVKLVENRVMHNMAPIGHSGFDLYLGPPGGQKYCSSTPLEAGSLSYQADLHRTDADGWKEFTLNFPLYNGVEEVLVGLSEDAEVAPPSPFASDRRIVIYGGSTVQGASASRPGACHMNIVGRRLNMEVINLGFSGSGKLEPEVAELVGGVERPAVFLVEGERNAGYDGVRTRLEPFIRILREKHPQTPIAIMTASKRAREALGPDDREKIFAFQKQLAGKLAAEGVYLLDGSEFLGEDFYECSIDGTHPTDLGFYRMAEKITEHLREVLGLCRQSLPR